MLVNLKVAIIDQTNDTIEPSRLHPLRVSPYARAAGSRDT